MTLVTLEHLTVHYEKKIALWEISCQLPAHQRIALVGPNGAGKTTLLKALLGLIPITKGHIAWTMQDKKLPTLAYVPQKESVDWSFPMTVEELVLMGCYGKLSLFQRVRQADRDQLERVLTRLGIAHVRQQQIAKLSGGQQQRAFLARAILQDADVYLLDEPFNGIDYTTQQLLHTIFQELQALKKSILVVHHDLNTVANFFDSLVLLNKHLIKSGPVEEVFTQSFLEKAYGPTLSLLTQAVSQRDEVQQGW